MLPQAHAAALSQHSELQLDRRGVEKVEGLDSLEPATDFHLVTAISVVTLHINIVQLTQCLKNSPAHVQHVRKRRGVHPSGRRHRPCQ